MTNMVGVEDMSESLSLESIFRLVMKGFRANLEADLLNGSTIEDLMTMPKESRDHILRFMLINKGWMHVHPGDRLRDTGLKDPLALDLVMAKAENLIGNTQLIEEARAIYYGENAFHMHIDVLMDFLHRPGASQWLRSLRIDIPRLGTEILNRADAVVTPEASLKALVADCNSLQCVFLDIQRDSTNDASPTWNPESCVSDYGLFGSCLEGKEDTVRAVADACALGCLTEEGYMYGVVSVPGYSFEANRDLDYQLKQIWRKRKEWEERTRRRLERSDATLMRHD